MKSTKLCTINVCSAALAEAAILEYWNREDFSMHIDNMKTQKEKVDKAFDEYISEIKAE